MSKHSVSLSDFPTPAVILPTYVGTLLHETPDGAHPRQEPCLGQLEIIDICHKEFGDLAMDDLYHKSTHATCTHILSCRHMSSRTHSADATGVKVDSAGVRKHFSISDYEKCINIHQPPIVLGFADEVGLGSGPKRLAKAVERTAAWHTHLVSSSSVDLKNTVYFGVAMPNPHYDTLSARLKDMLSSGGGNIVRGVVAGGAHMGESAAERAQLIKRLRSEIDAHLVNSSSSNYANKIPILVQGADTIEDILHDINSGADFVSTNYPKLNTCRGHGLVSNWKEVSFAGSVLVATAFVGNVHIDTDCITASRKRRVEVDQEDGSARKKQSTTADGTTPIQESRDEPDQYSLNLWDSKYCKDTAPILTGCGCLACVHHSRAYIHHLLIAKELLGEVLLYTHNQYQVLELFKAIREKK